MGCFEYVLAVEELGPGFGGGDEDVFSGGGCGESDGGEGGLGAGEAAEAFLEGWVGFFDFSIFLLLFGVGMVLLEVV